MCRTCDQMDIYYGKGSESAIKYRAAAHTPDINAMTATPNLYASSYAATPAGLFPYRHVGPVPTYKIARALLLLKDFRIRKTGTNLYWDKEEYEWKKLPDHYTASVCPLDESREFVEIVFGNEDKIPPPGVHPSTKEAFIVSEILNNVKGEQHISAPGGTISVSIGGDGFTRGTFTCLSGAYVKGYVAGGSWVWTSVETK